MRFRLALAVVAICGSTAAHALAEPTIEPPVDPARQLVIDGVHLREQGRDQEALAKFGRAYALAPRPMVLAQIALAEQALGRWHDAERDLSEAMKSADDSWIAANHDALAQAMTTIGMHLGTLQVMTDEANAELFLDGKSLGRVESGSSYRVEIGTRNVELRATGKYSSARSVVIAPGEISRETIELQPLPLQATQTPAPHRDDDRAHEDQHAKTIDNPGSTQRNIGWVFLGTAGALVVTGVAGIVARDVEISSYNDDGSCPGLHSLDQPPICQSKITTAQTWTTVSILGFVGSGVLAAGGVVLVLTAPKSSVGSSATGPREQKKRDPPGFFMTCAGLLGISCFGRF